MEAHQKLHEQYRSCLACAKLKQFKLLKLDVQVFKLRKTVGKRVRESVLQFDVFQQYVDEPACAVYKNFCH